MKAHENEKIERYFLSDEDWYVRKLNFIELIIFKKRINESNDNFLQQIKKRFSANMLDGNPSISLREELLSNFVIYSNYSEFHI